MATVIDELVIQIGLDLKNMRSGVSAAEVNFKRLRDEAEGTAKRVEESGKRASQFFATMKTEALAFVAVLTGGAGLMSALNSTARSMGDLGRAATSLNNMNPQALDAWGQALKRIGGNAEDAITSFNNIGQALANYKLRGDTAIIPFLNAIGGNTTMTPEQIALRFSQYIRQHPEKTNQEINVIGQGLGVTQSMTNLLRTGPQNVSKELELSRALGLRTQEMIDVATKFNHDFTALSQAAEHLKDKFEVGLMPTADKVILWLTHFMEENPNTATAVGIGGTAVGGALGGSAIARMLGLTALSDALGMLTVLFTRLAGVLGFLGLTGPAGGEATPEQQQAAEAAREAEKHGPVATWINKHWPFADPTIHRTGENGGTSLTTDPSGGSSASTDSATRARAQAVHDEFVKQGTDDTTAWALAANSVAESRAMVGGPTGDAGRAHGLFMWRDDEASGGRALKFQQMFGHLPEQGTLEESVKFLRWEMANTERGAAARIAQAQGVGGKAAAVSQFLIRPKDVEAEKRHRAQIANGLAPGPRSDRATSSGGYIPDPGLLPMPGERGESNGVLSPFHTSSTSMDVGTINIHTAATNADGIAKEIHGKLSDHLIQQSNIGLT